MRLQSSGVVLLCAAAMLIVAPFVSAKPTTAPSSTQPSATTAPSTAPSSPSTPDANPGATPSTQQAAAPHFPTPQEIAEKWKKAAKQEDALTKVAYLDLSGKVTEKPETFMFLAARDDSTTLHNVV